MLNNTRNTKKTLLIASLLGFLVTPANSATTDTSALCAGASPILTGETVRGIGRVAGEPDCFRIETPAGGLLALDVAVPGPAAAAPRLGLVESCAGSETEGLAVIDRTATSLVVAGKTAVSLVACVGPQDPRLALGEYKLAAAFVDAAKSDPIEVEPDPGQKSDPIEVEPDPGQKSDPIEVEPDPGQKALLIDALCAAATGDDHSDLLLCASILEPGRKVRGEIADRRGDDHDTFAFELAATHTLRFETSGSLDTFGGVYDDRGQRLAADDDGGEGGNFRLVKTLGPGLYFVRVEGQAGAEGSYVLDVAPLDSGW